MKIRTDFVTNSSSSSFILAFSSKDKVIYSLMEDYTGGHLETLVMDILSDNAKTKTKQEALDYYRENIYYNTKWAIEEKLKKEKCMSYFEFSDWSQSHKEEIEKIVKNEIDEKVKELEEKIGNNKYIVMVNYGDGDKDLENEIAPYLSSCKASISFH